MLPSLEVIRELVTRGHRVTYAIDPAVADLVTDACAEFVPCASVLPVADNNWPEDPIAAQDLFLDNAIQSLPQLRADTQAEGGTLRAADLIERTLG